MSEPARWPGYLPYPTEIKRWGGRSSVPNAQSIDWPQSQFAPLYLRPGSPSFQPYRYPAGGPLKRFQPLNMDVPTGSGKGPAGDIVQVRTKPWGPLPKAPAAKNPCDCGGAYGGGCGCGGSAAKNNPDLPVNAVIGAVVLGAAAFAWWWTQD